MHKPLTSYKVHAASRFDSFVHFAILVFYEGLVRSDRKGGTTPYTRNVVTNCKNELKVNHNEKTSRNNCNIGDLRDKS